MMKTENGDQGEVEVAGNATRVLSETVSMDKLVKPNAKNNFVLASIGKLIEQNETQVRRDIKGQLLDKSKLIINTGRLSHEYKVGADSSAFQAELMAAVRAGKK
jgi:diaminopimelate epimerase